MEKFVNPETIAKMQSDIKKKAGLYTNNKFKGNNDFEKSPTVNGEPIVGTNLNGTNYLMVYGIGTPTENAAELQAAYNAAKTMPRFIGGFYGSESPSLTIYKGQTARDIDADGDDIDGYFTVNQDYINTPWGDIVIDVITKAQAKAVRSTVIVAPGEYDFGDTTFAVDATNIDLVSLTGNSDIKINGSILVSVDNVYLKGIYIDNNSGYIAVATNTNNTFENCISRFSSTGAITGKYISCVGSFYSETDELSGTFIECKRTNAAWNSDSGIFASSTMINCINPYPNPDIIFNYPPLTVEPVILYGTGNSSPSISVPLIEALISIGINLRGANLMGANLDTANLNNANFTSANLESASLNNVDMEGANLTSANLTDVILTNSRVNSTNFYRATLNGISLTNSSLASAMFVEATGLNEDINIALADVNKNPNGDNEVWTLTWTDNWDYSCDPTTGLFTIVE